MRVGAALGLLLVSSNAAAERSLGLKETLALARQNSRELAAGRARVQQADAGVTQASAALLPTLAAQGRYTHNNKQVELDLAAQNAPLVALADALKSSSTDPATIAALNQFESRLAAASPEPVVIQKQDQLDASLNLSVPLVVPSAYAGLSAARRSRESAQANYEVSESAELLAAAQAFFVAAGADELDKVSQHGIRVAQQTLDNARARFASGNANRVEVTRAQLSAMRAQQTALETAERRARAYRALATRIDLHEPFQVEPTETSVRALVPLAALQRQALVSRPELRALERANQAFEAQGRAAALRWAPTLSGFANARAFNYRGFSGDQYAWAVGATLDWVLYDGGSRSAASELASAGLAESRARWSSVRDGIVDEVADALGDVETKRKALSTAQGSVTLSSETLELVRAQYQAGTVTQIELLQAQDALIAAEVSLAQAHFDLALAQLSLDRASGAFPSKEN